MPSVFKRIAVGTSFLALTLIGAANPNFITSTFETGLNGWEPDNPWTTSDIDGLTPGNDYLRIEAVGSGKGGKMITFNPTSEWTGNYFSAGVTGIRMDVSNWSESDTVFLRIALGNRANPQQSGGTWFLSNTAIVIPNDGVWSNVFLPLNEPDLVRVANLIGEVGTDTYAATFSDIRNIRILSAEIPLGAIGDEFVGNVGIDNIMLVPEQSQLPLAIGIGLAVIGIRKRWLS
jgi:hypothetical protein